MTGEAIYYDHFESLDDFLQICRNANSLPILARVGHYKGVPMMDGGMADAIPISKALELGWEKIVVIFTREASYRKTPRGDVYDNWYTKLFYRKYPGLLHAIDVRPDVYNGSIEKVHELEKEGKVFVYRPPDDVILTNNETNPDTLRNYYKIGYELAKDKHQKLMEFLNA